MSNIIYQFSIGAIPSIISFFAVLFILCFKGKMKATLIPLSLFVLSIFIAYHNREGELYSFSINLFSAFIHGFMILISMALFNVHRIKDDQTLYEWFTKPFQLLTAIAIILLVDFIHLIIKTGQVDYNSIGYCIGYLVALHWVISNKKEQAINN